MASLDRNIWICASGTLNCNYYLVMVSSTTSPSSHHLLDLPTHPALPKRQSSQIPPDGDLAGVQEFLEEGGMDVNAADEFGYTCLHAAASYGHVGLVQFLIGRGGNVALRDPDGDTPLHVCEEVDVAQVLVENGADPQSQNMEGKRPHDIALEDGHLPLGNYLRGLCGLPPLTAAQAQAAMAALESQDNGEQGEDQEVHQMGLQDLQAFVEGQEEEQEEDDVERGKESGMEENKMAE